MNFLQKLWLKINNPSAYYTYKQQRLFENAIHFNQKINTFVEKNIEVRTFKHAGNAGDIIYSLPIVASLYNTQPTKQQVFYLHIHKKGHYKKGHFLGNVMLDEKTATMFVPLIETQHYVQKVSIIDERNIERQTSLNLDTDANNIVVNDISINDIDYNLDLFRDLPLLLDKGDISRWYFHVFNVFYDLSNAWLNVTPNKNFSNTIVLARSGRYQNPHINFSFLKKYDTIVFLGVESEFKAMQVYIPTLVWQPIKDFLEMAQIIAGCKVFIGNQSFPYSIAEAIKVNRILELCYYAPNVIIHGKNGYDFYFQQHFEYLVELLFSEEQIS